MLTHAEIDRIVGEIAAANFRPDVFDRVHSFPTADLEGKDALRIMIVIAPGTADKLSGDALVDTIFQVQERLRNAGEERFPILEYAEADEVEADDDPESEPSL